MKSTRLQHATTASEKSEFETDPEDAHRLLESSTVAVAEIRPPTEFTELVAQGLAVDADSGAVTEAATRLLRAADMTWLNESAVRLLGATDKADAKRAFARWTSSRADQSLGIAQLMVASLSESWATGDFTVVSGGRQADVEMTWASLHDESGHIRFIATLHDVTDDMQVIRDLATRQADLEEALARSSADLDLTEHQLTATVELILSLVALRDHYTSTHMRDAAELADAIAQRLDCSPAVIPALKTAALVHDVGKLAMPADLLSKTAALSRTEMMLMHEHARIGGELLVQAGFERDVVEIVAQHHERWDGSGYPQGLCGEDIAQGARILAVADTIVSMGCHRPYRAALPPEVVYAEIESGSGVRYDSKVATAALEILRERQVQS